MSHVYQNSNNSNGNNPYKRAKTMEALIREELSRPSSHSSHFDDAPPPARKPQDKRITELLAEKLQQELILQGHELSHNTATGTVASTGTVPTATTPWTQSIRTCEPEDGDLPQVSLHASFYVQGVKIGWPFPVVMPPQRQMALHIIKALQGEKHVVLESPTGTGKSAAILCSVLAWQRHYQKKLANSSSRSHRSGSGTGSGAGGGGDTSNAAADATSKKSSVKIIYCSRTHSQVTQMISSLRQTPYRPRMAVLGSRERLCINQAVRESSGNVNTECRVRVANTDSLRKYMYTSKNQMYDDNEPPTNLPQDTMTAQTTATSAADDEEEGDDYNQNGPARMSNKCCCSHYRQLGTDRTAQLVTKCLVPTCGPKEGGKASRHGSHNVEDLVEFGTDPHVRRQVALYRKNGAFGMMLVVSPSNRRIIVQHVHSGSAAAAANIRVGDEILTVNGETFPNVPNIDIVAERMKIAPNPLLLDITSSSDLVLRQDDYDTKSSSPHSPCPYYISRALAKHAELVFCPYNYVLDPFIRDSLEISLEGNVVILDEAHNVEDTLRESGSGTYGEFELAEIVIMLQYYSSMEKSHKNKTEDETRDVSDCAHELLMLVETLLLHLISQKVQFEQNKAPKILEEWKKFHTSDETDFDVDFHGPNGHGVHGKAIGCQSFFDKLNLQTMDTGALRNTFAALDQSVRSQQDWQRDKFSSALDKLGELITILGGAFSNTEHYYIATVAKANGSLEFASGTIMQSSSNVPKRKPQRLPLIAPRKPDAPHLPLPVCLHPSCRASRISHGEYCNGALPPWQAFLVIELLTPAQLFADLRTQCRTVILASGSLAPIPSLCAELGLSGAVVDRNKTTVTPLKPVNAVPAKIKDTVTDKPAPAGRLQVQPQPLEANHVIDLDKQLLAVSVGYFPDGSPLTVNYSHWNRPDFIDKLGNAIATVVEGIPTGGVLCFLPSYSFLRKCIQKWNPNANGGDTWGRSHNGEIWERLLASKGRVIVEPSGSLGGGQTFEHAKQDYADTIATTGKCILFAVFRGKMSEGISFNDANARGVILCGIPYPNAFSRSIVAKKKYNDEQRKVQRKSDMLSGNDWYCQQAYRAIAQALGRCIRHAADYGAIILMDSRHCNDGMAPSDCQIPRVHQRLPKWMRHGVRNMDKSSTMTSHDIAGGWPGLQREMARFFAQAPIHGQQVLEQQRAQLQRQQEQQGTSCAAAMTATIPHVVHSSSISVTPTTPQVVDLTCKK